MACWCDAIERLCGNCEQKEVWKSLDVVDQAMLIKYATLIKKKKPEWFAMSDVIDERGLCISMIPSKILRSYDLLENEETPF